MTAPPQIPADVQERAETAGENHARKTWRHGNREYRSLAVDCREDCREGYLLCYTHERARIELAALEGMVKKLCEHCKHGMSPIVPSHTGEFYHRGAFASCAASALHARISQLRKEIK